MSAEVQASGRAAPGAGVAASAAGEVLSAEVQEAVDALAAHGIALDALGFGRELTRRRAQAGQGPLQVIDLAIAWACGQGNEPAINHFERAFFPQATRALARMKLSATLSDDVLGWMRFELFARAKGPLISTYSGRGELGSWVRSIAVHEALKRVRRQRRDVTPEAAADIPMPAPELAAMRGAYGAEFTRALEESFAALSPQERNLLRQYFLDGLSIDTLAGLHEVHRATAARRVSAARTALVDRVRAALVRELALSQAGVDAVITLSNLKESLGQLLRKTRGGS